MNGPFSFITNNLSMLGFHQELPLAFLQCIVELIENSIDACYTNVYPSCVMVSVNSIADGVLEIKVLDEGSGIENLLTILESFHTTKSGSQQRTIGKFGIGLTASLAYSFASSQAACRIITKSITKSSCDIIDITFDEIGKPAVHQNTSIPKLDMKSGTMVKIYVKSNSQAILAKEIVQHLREYIFLASLNLHSPVKLVTVVNLSTLATSFEAATRRYTSMAAINTSNLIEPNQTIYNQLYGNVLGNIFPECHLVDCSILTNRIDETMEYELFAGVLEGPYDNSLHEYIVTHQVPLPQTKPSSLNSSTQSLDDVLELLGKGGDDDEETDQECLFALPIKVIRIINGKPLKCKESESDCDLLKIWKQFPWNGELQGKLNTVTPQKKCHDDIIDHSAKASTSQNTSSTATESMQNIALTSNPTDIADSGSVLKEGRVYPRIDITDESYYHSYYLQVNMNAMGHEMVNIYDLMKKKVQAWKEHSQCKQIVVIMNIVSGTAKYGNLRKTFITNMNADHKKVILKDMIKLFRSLKKSPSLQDYYPSLQKQWELAMESHRPYLREGIMRIIQYSQNPQIATWVNQTMNWPYNDAYPSIQDAIDDKLAVAFQNITMKKFPVETPKSQERDRKRN